MKLKIVIVSDKESWMSKYIEVLAEGLRKAGHLVKIVTNSDYDKVDVAFFLSYSRIVSAEVLARAKSNIVVHGSELPKGRGWSPWSWEIADGKNYLALTLFEASEGVDSGPIYDQRWVRLEGHELVDEWRGKQAKRTIEMCYSFIKEFPTILERGRSQSGVATYYPRRKPKDSQINPDKTIAEQFGIFRVADNLRYPVYFKYEGHVYTLKIEKKYEIKLE